MDGITDHYKYIVSGDSISKGVVYDEEKGKYVVLEDNYVSILQAKLKGIIRNTARFGNTLTKGVNRLHKDVLVDSPDVVLIEYGGNDCDFNWNEIADNPTEEHCPKTDFHLFELKLKEAIHFLKSEKIIPVLMTLPPLNADKYLKWVSKNNPLTESCILEWLGSATKIYWWQERYNSMVIKVAQETRTKWIDKRGAFLQYPDYTKFLCVDGIHPNQEGHRIIAEKVLEYIQAGYDFLLKDDRLPELI
ncbi:MAG: SGNH/GDSL hydrolase family protein [Gorillibacterium sp.]|nr:SGNH/GDSL hydrolase family protein [Gorillibacterium sp.]